MVYCNISTCVACVPATRLTAHTVQQTGEMIRHGYMYNTQRCKCALVAGLVIEDEPILAESIITRLGITNTVDIAPRADREL